MVNWVLAPMRTPLCPRKFKHFRYCNYIDMLHQLAFVIVRLWKHTDVCLCACVHNKEVAEIWPFNYWKKNEKSWFWNSCIFCREYLSKWLLLVQNILQLLQKMGHSGWGWGCYENLGLGDRNDRLIPQKVSTVDVCLISGIGWSFTDVCLISGLGSSFNVNTNIY